MDRVFLLTAMLLVSLSAYSQKIRFTDPSNEWVYKIGTRTRTTVAYRYDKERFITDTTINSYVYKRLRYGFGGPFHVREDSSANKVYILNPDKNYSEEIFFDYNWAAGDTIKWFYQFLPQVQYLVISSVGSVLINGVAHKVFYTSGNFIFIEGILVSFEARFINVGILHSYELCSFKNNGIYPYISVLPSNNQQPCFPSGTKDITPPDDRILVYPQPAISHVSIELPRFIGDGSAIIINNLGQVVFHKKLSSERTIEVGNTFSQGLYFYRITDNTTNNIYSGKLIFAD